MKKIIAVLIVFCLALSLASCGKTEQEVIAEKMQAVEELKQEINFQDIVAVNGRVYTNAEGKKGLTADLKNRLLEDVEVSECVIAFVMWDAYGVPLVIKTEQQPNSTYFIMEVTMGDFSVEGNGTGESTMGMLLSDASYDAAYVEAIAISGNINGKKWENPCYEAWQKMYADEVLELWQRESMTCYSSVVETASSDKAKEEEDSVTFSEFYGYMLDEEMVAINAGAYLQEDGRNALMADVINREDVDATEIMLAFAAWDSEGNPILLRSASGLTEDNYVKEVNYADLSIKAGSTWESDMGLIVSNDYSTISHVEGIVVSCKLGGKEWTNPHYEVWADFFGGKKLDSQMTDAISALTE